MQRALIEVVTRDTADFTTVRLDAVYMADGVSKSYQIQSGGELVLRLFTTSACTLALSSFLFVRSSESGGVSHHHGVSEGKHYRLLWLVVLHLLYPQMLRSITFDIGADEPDLASRT